MNDLLAAFGIGNGDFEKDKEKKREKKTEKKPKKETGRSYSLPIRFSAGHLQHLFQSESEEKWSERKLKDEIGERFRELKGVYYQIVPVKVQGDSENEEKDSVVTAHIAYTELEKIDELEFPVEIVAGTEVLPISEAETVADIQKSWVSAHPEYAGCKFHYVSAERILIPYLEPNAVDGKVYTFPVTVGYLDIKETYETDDFESETVIADVLRSRYIAKYPEFTDCKFAYQEEMNLLFPLITAKQESVENKRIALPVEVRAGGFQLLVQPEDINGKQDASLEEIRKVLENIYPEYAKERTEMVYDKHHFIVPILKSSRKGLLIRSTDSSWNHEEFTDIHGHKWRRETTPFGYFEANLTLHTQVDFKWRLPKIPISFARKAIECFEKDPAKEYAVQIFYDCETRQYELYNPKQYTTAASVIFQRNWQQEKEKVLVMDIHSHGHYPAFFSLTDDEDEKGIRLYMVVGGLHLPVHSYAVRAGMTGIFRNLNLEDVFE